MSYTLIKQEIARPYSSSKAFSQTIKANPQWSDAIIMAEPSSMLEALPYYINNPLYIYRENRFGKKREFTTKSLVHTNMELLLSTSLKLQNTQAQDIIILIDDRINESGPYTFTHSYGNTFTYSKKFLHRFLELTTKIKTFDHALSDENYTAYILKK